MTGTNFSSWFNATQGTMYCNFDTVTVGATNNSFYGIDNGSSNGYILYRPAASNLLIYLGSNQTTIGTITANTSQQAAYTYNTTPSMSASGSLNGATAISIISPTALSYTPTQLSLGKHSAASGLITGHIRKFAYYPQAVTSAQLQALTGT
jgi:hypothetical protein